MKIMIFWKTTLKISFRTGQLFLCDNFFEKKGTEKNTLGIWSIQGEVQYTINLLMYVNVIFAKNMSKNHFYPICDALASKVLITHKLVFLWTRYLLFSF